MVAQPVLDAFSQEMLGVFRNGEHRHLTDIPIQDLSIAEAYLVQEGVILARMEEGERPVGYKIGCTSRAIQAQFGFENPISGRIMAPFLYDDGVFLGIGKYVDLAVEPELVFTIGRTLEGEQLPDQVLRAAIEGVSAGIEIHNYKFFHGKPSAQELIASNGIHAALVVHPEAYPLRDLDLALEGVGIWIDGHLQQSAINAEILGKGPLESLRWLVGRLAERGEKLEAGQLVIPGSAVGLVRVSNGCRVTARFTNFGFCEAIFEPGTGL